MKIEEDKLNKKFIDVLEQIACTFPAIGHKDINGKIKKQKQIQNKYYDIIKKYREQELNDEYDR